MIADVLLDNYDFGSLISNPACLKGNRRRALLRLILFSRSAMIIEGALQLPMNWLIEFHNLSTVLISSGVESTMQAFKFQCPTTLENGQGSQRPIKTDQIRN